MVETDFKLPSQAKEIEKKEAQANQTVIVEATSPCYVNNTYHAGGVRFMADKSVADGLVKSGCAFIVEN